MSEHRGLEVQLVFFLEGAFVGVYGNWLISFFEKISFTLEYSYLVLQLLCISLAMLAFVYFFWYTISSEFQDFEEWTPGAIALGHTILLWIPLLIELGLNPGLQSFSNYIKFNLFMTIGVSLWVAIYAADAVRHRILRKKARPRQKSKTKTQKQ